MTVGERIRQTRKELGLSQREVAQGVGVTVQALSQWERDKSGLHIGSFMKLGQILNCDPWWLMLGKETQKTVLSPSFEDYSQVPVVGLVEALQFADKVRYKDYYKRYAFTDVGFAGTAFAIEVRTEMFPEFADGDILIFDNAIQPRLGDIVLAGLPQDPVADSVQDESDLFAISLWRVSQKGSSERMFLFEPINPRLLTSTYRERFGVMVGVMVERRTYRQK